jgi:hypothetical protein
MIETKSHGYAFNRSWIEFKAPNEQGVYWLRDQDGKTLFVGKGNILERLLSHWNRENSTDLAIWDRNPCSFRFELTGAGAEAVSVSAISEAERGKNGAGKNDEL